MKITVYNLKNIARIKRDVFSKTGKQSIILYSSHLLLLPLGILISSINTRLLGPENYGVYSFFNTITRFAVLFFRFGIFSSGGLLLAQEKTELRKKELIGTLLILCLFIGIAFSFFNLMISLFIDKVFKTNISHILQFFSPLLIVLPFNMLISKIGEGTNKINLLALFNLIPKSLYLSGLLSLLFLLKITHINVSVSLLIFLNLISIATGTIIIIYTFKPLFDNFKEYFQKILQKNREYGIHLYWGQVVSQSTYKLDGMFISYFVNTTQLGFYHLANTLTSPMVLFSHSLSVSLFKPFVKHEKIPKKIIYCNFLWLLIWVIGLSLFRKYIVILLFSEKFLSVAPLIVPFALSSFFMGLKEPYNSFLAAHGKGIMKRNIAYMVGTVNFIGNILFIPIWGVWGAVITTLLGQIISYTSHIWYYKKVITEKNLF